MADTTIQDTIQDVLACSANKTAPCNTSVNTVSNYLQASECLSHRILCQNTSGLESFLRDFSTGQHMALYNTSTTSRDVFFKNGSLFPTNFHQDGTNLQADANFFLERHQEMEWPVASSGQPATFTTRGQVRRGSNHGKGGRMPGSGAQVRHYYSKYARIVLRKRIFSLLSPPEPDKGCSEDSTGTNERPDSICEYIVAELCRRKDISGTDISKFHYGKVRERLLKEAERSVGEEAPNAVEHLPLAVLGVSARFSKSDSVQNAAGRQFNVRERHIVNTWLDRKGHVRCTCIGSTQYDILALNEEFYSPCCQHAEAFLDTLKEISDAIFEYKVPFQIIYNALAIAKPEVVDGDDMKLPLLRTTHNGKDAVLICEDVSGGRELCWVPIRKIMRGGGRFLCAFCDMISTNRCHHLQSVNKLCEGGTMSQLGGPENGEEYEENAGYQGIEHEETARSKNHQPVSTLPVGPINCQMALRVDQEICELVKRNGVFKLKAPLLCTYCQSKRIEDTRSENTSGVVMCSIGACRMEVDTYTCSGCRKQFSAEGRQQGLFVDSVCLAATHKLLRDQLIGFALGNGTLSSRLDQFHSQVTAFEDAKLFQNQLPCRSTRKLYDLCIYFVRLMVCQPDASLFFCPTCQGNNSPSHKRNKGSEVPRAICVDGIWAGYLKKSVTPFENVSQPCRPIASFSRSVKSSFHKPRTSFLRLDKTVKLLLHAVKGKSVEVNCGSIDALVSAVRLVDSTVLPIGFYETSVCGTFPQDYKHDIGESSLSRLRDLTCTLFHKHTLIYRLLEPLQKLFQRQGKRRKTTKGGSSKKDYGNAYSVVTTSIANITNLLQDDEGVCWNNRLRTLMQKADCGKKTLQLFQALLQGPLTHLIRREEICSAKKVAEACIKLSPKDFMKVMVKKRNFSSLRANNSGENTEESQDDTNIVKNVRTLEGGLFAAALIDKSGMEDSTQFRPLLPALGHVIEQAVDVVSHFHTFYAEHVTKGGSDAAKYAAEWDSRDFSYLREKFVILSKSDRFQPSWGPDYDDPFVTGAYFPSLPQVRPLPFNDKKTSKITDVEVAFGFCSKHYLQRNASFTPGAITFSCSCAHPVVLGFKVLERDEGPRAVLDVLLSRFPLLPRFIIYDFACGVYKSAISSLWWVVQDCSLVSDSFHADNHTCSPAFQPTAHVNLNMVNTLSHEQRNRPIAKIKGSLQQTSQDVYISLLAYQILINNIQARGRTAGEHQVPVQNRSAKDIEWTFFDRLQYSCPCCELRTAS